MDKLYDRADIYDLIESEKRMIVMSNKKKQWQGTSGCGPFRLLKVNSSQR